MRLLRSRLDAPQLRDQARLTTATALWRMRVTVDDRAGTHEQLASALTDLDVNVLDVRVHPLEHAARDQLIVSAPEGVTELQLVDAVTAAGGADVSAWHTTALALVHGPTRALSLAARTAERPSELASAVAELLGARVLTDQLAASGHPVRHGAGESVLRVATRGGVCSPSNGRTSPSRPPKLHAPTASRSSPRSPSSPRRRGRTAG